MDLHECSVYDYGITRSSYFDIAVDFCWEHDNGTLWVTNSEYESQVNYCPFCGYKALSQIKFIKCKECGELVRFINDTIYECNNEDCKKFREMKEYKE